MSVSIILDRGKTTLELNYETILTKFWAVFYKKKSILYAYVWPKMHQKYLYVYTMNIVLNDQREGQDTKLCA